MPSMWEAICQAHYQYRGLSMYVRINNNSPSGDRVCSGHRIQSSGAGIYKPSGRRSDRVIGALVIVWTVFVVITLLYTTSFGKEMYRMIQSDAILKTIYEYNPIMKLATIFR